MQHGAGPSRPHEPFPVPGAAGDLFIGTQERWPPPDSPCVQTWSDAQGRPCARGFASATEYLLDWRGVARYIVRRDSTAVLAVPAPGADEALVRETYERTVVPLVWQLNGGEAVHASAVRWRDGAVLLCARSGTGKSTFALALMRRGYSRLADDGVLLDPRVTPVRALGVGRDARLRLESARYFNLPDPAPGGRLSVSAGEPGREPLPLRGIAVLQRTAAPREPDMRPVSGGEALAAVLDHAHCADPTSDVVRRRMLENYVAVVASCPVWMLTYASGFDRFESVLQLFERTLASST